MGELQAKIIYRYQKLSRFVFHYLVFLIALVVAVVLFEYIISQPSPINVFQTNENLVMQKTRLIAEFGKFLKQNIQDNDTQIHILQGDFQTNQGFITSINNLISYKGFVVPRYFYLYGTIPVKPLNYFSGGMYAVDELENFVHTIVFTKKIAISKPFSRVQLPINTSLVEDFNLACVFENKLSQRACNYYLNSFLDSFFVYTISLDYPGLQSIFAALSTNNKNKGRICEGLSKYLLYANDHSQTIKDLFVLCGSAYEETFKRTTLFMEIQATLENQSFDKTIYKDPLLNIYKLLSYQQQIYQDFLINKPDTYKISVYLDLVRELLTRKSIDPFYIDETYRYNNKYLAPSLEKLTYQSTTFTQNIGSSKIASLLTTINGLNEGESLLGFAGLVAQVQNTGLVTEKNIINESVNTTTIAERIEKKLQNLSYLTIEKQSISDNILDVVGYLTFASPDTNETIKVHIIMEYTNELLLVKSIELQNKAEINDVIKNLLLIQNFSLGELYSYISKNLVFYGQEDTLISSTEDLCPGLKKLKDITVIACTPTLATIDKNSLRYSFTFKNGGIQNIHISDTGRENAIKTDYSTIVGKTYTLFDTLKAILQYIPPKKTYEGTNNAILVFETIQNYLGIKANDIADNNNKILVDISLGGINFIVNYTLATNTLGPWYFKDILSNGKPYLIKNLSIILDDKHKNDSNTFVIDPLAAIKIADITARNNYIAKLKK